MKNKRTYLTSFYPSFELAEMINNKAFSNLSVQESLKNAIKNSGINNTEHLARGHGENKKKNLFEE